MSNIKRNTGLNCGCCGSYFHTWIGYEDQDQDCGYGICFECQEDAEERNNEELDKLVVCVRSALSDKNLKQFDSKTLDEQRAFAFSCLDKGYIKFSFGRE